MEDQTQMEHGMEFSFLRKAVLLGATLVGSALLLGAPHARADEVDCQRRVVRIDHDLHRAAAKHGWDSPQAEAQRAKLKIAREWCWEHGHRWWNEDDRKWHSDRDWDDHDHDHDRPHDH
jgi:hypothetical protein